MRGKNNPNWRGGRTITSHGYVLVRVGAEHHLADCRGYAYEHRIVAERILGRRLKPGEIIHHKNGNKQDNRKRNIMIVGGNTGHLVHHRQRRDLRMPSTPNPTILCGCGCGRDLKKYDGCGRPRTYISGHNPMRAIVQTAIMESLKTGPLHRSRIAFLCGKSLRQVQAALYILKKAGRVYQVERGMWGLSDVNI